MMSGIGLHVVQEPIPSVEAGPPAETAEDRLASEPGRDRLVEVMLALSGHMGMEEADGARAPEVDQYRSDATLERLAMLGMCFGL